MNGENVLEITNDVIYSEGEVTWMHDMMGYHKIGNPGEDVAVTLHVYSPPYETSTIFDSENNKMQVSCSFDTEGGV